MEYYSKNDIEKCFVNSFDVFDTLLARKVLRPTDIFSIVEETYNIPNFKERRCIAQNNSNGTIENIYQKYGEIYNIDPYICKEIKELEVDYEKWYESNKNIEEAEVKVVGKTKKENKGEKNIVKVKIIKNKA